MLKRELKIFLTSLMFFTRLPVWRLSEFTQEMHNKASRYLPMVGWIVGGVAALVFWLCSLILPVNVAVLISMGATVLLTGAFHEDGFSDVCDGFGGGYTPEQTLTIMKDSRVGAYGVIGTFFILGLKWALLVSLPVAIIPIALIAGHSISRMFAVLVIATADYVKENPGSKSKPLAHRLGAGELIFTIITGLLPLLLMHWTVSLSLVLALLAFVWFRAYTLKKLKGYSGDCLGAMQQITEVAFYLGTIIVI